MAVDDEHRPNDIEPVVEFTPQEKAFEETMRAYAKRFDLSLYRLATWMRTFETTLRESRGLSKQSYDKVHAKLAEEGNFEQLEAALKGSVVAQIDNDWIQWDETNITYDVLSQIYDLTREQIVRTVQKMIKLNAGAQE